MSKIIKKKTKEAKEKQESKNQEKKKKAALEKSIAESWRILEVCARSLNENIENWKEMKEVFEEDKKEE